MAKRLDLVSWRRRDGRKLCDKKEKGKGKRHTFTKSCYDTHQHGFFLLFLLLLFSDCLFYHYSHGNTISSHRNDRTTHLEDISSIIILTTHPKSLPAPAEKKKKERGRLFYSHFLLISENIYSIE
jgi:hypothetical protein